MQCVPVKLYEEQTWRHSKHLLSSLDHLGKSTVKVCDWKADPKMYQLGQLFKRLDPEGQGQATWESVGILSNKKGIYV